MNRLVLIGNGFDCAHNLPTRYRDFFYWYWENRFNCIYNERTNTSEDILCSITTLKYESWYMFIFYNRIGLSSLDREEFYKKLCNKNDFTIKYTPFFDRIRKSIEEKRWVDIETEYYELLKFYSQSEDGISQIEMLNKQLYYLQEKLVEYLKTIEISDKLIRSDITQKIYAPFNISDFSPEGQQALKKHVATGLEQDTKSWEDKLSQYGSICYTSGYVSSYRDKHQGNVLLNDELPVELLLPNHIMLLSFNYTNTANLYCKEGSIFSVNQIHGNFDNPLSIIFGYGDEIDEGYNKLKNMNDNECLRNMKQIKYMMADNYDRLESFLGSEPFQVYLMGHSCGNSDRTLLNMIFEHRNCVSIKPYYYINDNGEDNYLELTMNISRDFIEDTKLMRNRMVKKPNCEPLTNF